MVEYAIISTGSKGNAVIIGTQILIDCGVSFKAIEPYMKDLKLVLLTHIHGDHFKASTIRRLAELRPTLRFACGEWLVIPLLQCGVDKKNIDVIEPHYDHAYKAATVSMFEVEHDVRNCGYKIHLANGQRVFYVTDAGNLNGVEAKNYDLYMIEGDYDKEELEQRISDKKADGKFIYERRVEGNHLSKQQCLDFVAQNAGPDSMFIYMHEHAEGVKILKGETHEIDEK